MSTLLMNKGSWLMALAIFLSTSAYAMPTGEEELIDTINFKTFYGKVVDAMTARTLPFATIEATGINTATVTNIDGEFTIKITKGTDIPSLKISYLGFSNKIVPMSQFKGDKSLTIKLPSTAIQLKEITIRPQDAMALIADISLGIFLSMSFRTAKIVFVKFK